MDITRERINEIKDKLAASKARILSEFPFYGVLAMDTKFFLDEKENNFSTNGKDIYFNPAYILSLTDEEVDISILHEIFHILLKHPVRYKESMNNDLYHLAADIIVNSNIMHSNDRKDPIYVRGKLLPYLAPNGKDGYNYTTEEIYKMLCKKYPHKVGKNTKKDDEKSNSAQDELDNSGIDTNENQVGPEMVNPSFKYTPDNNGKIYFRGIAYKDMHDYFHWDIEEDYQSPTYEASPLLLTSDKLSQIRDERHVKVEVINDQDYICCPDYMVTHTLSYYDLESVQLAKQGTLSYYQAIASQTLIDELCDLKFTSPKLAKIEKNYSKFVYKSFLTISPLHKNYFLKFAKDRNIVGEDKNIIMACRDAIAQSAKYDLEFTRDLSGKDPLLYFLSEEKKGICFHFASALVYLYRALGIPARYVGGVMVDGAKDITSIAFLESGHAWVEVYLKGTGWIKVDPTPISASTVSMSSSGNGNNDQKKPDEKDSNGNGFDNHDRWKQLNDDEELMSDDEINSKIIKANDLREMGGHGRDNLPGFIEALIRDLTQPKIDWRTVLNEFIQENVVDFSFLTPDYRLQDSDFILPSFTEKDKEVKNVLFMVDCSGSMALSDIADCFSEIQGAINQFDGKLKGYLGFFDTMVYKLYEIDDQTDVKKLKPIGRGGTNFECVFKYIKAKMSDNLPTSIIILTDGEAPYPDERKAMDIPTLWVINNNRATPPWGRVLKLIRNEKGGK